MLTNEGTNCQGQTHWKLHVPEEHCTPGLEVGIFATANGLMIGGNVIPWAELEVAKLKTRGCTFTQPAMHIPAGPQPDPVTGWQIT